MMKRDTTDEPPLWAVGLFLLIAVGVLLLLWVLVERHVRSARPTGSAEVTTSVAHADPIPFAASGWRPGDRRLPITAYIASITAKHGRGPEQRHAANQLVWLESVGGARAELMAAVVTQESGWYVKARNRISGALGLCQILPSTARSVYGRLPESWGENLYMGSTYLQGCIDAELNARHPEPVRAGLARYNGGPGKPPAAWGYARDVLHERAKLP